MQTKENLLFAEAEKFIEIYYSELNLTESELEERLEEIRTEINETGTYTHTYKELEYGAKMAWRNSNKCIGRLVWNTLHVVDARHVNSTDDAYHQLLNHIHFATNNGKIRSTITIFPPEKADIAPMRIWNHQLIRYAGYEDDDNIIGDSTSVEFTQQCERLGWRGKRTDYDVLPLVIQKHGQEPGLFTIPDSFVKEVAIQHPNISGFEQLNMKWYAVPMISDMRLEIGGINYPMAPFNGWYMGTEIGARNLADENRYNFLPKIAKLMDMETKSNRTLWKDKALVELNVAVLDSYQKAGVTIIDHHTAAQQFKVFEKKEHENNRKVTGNWTWLIPPVSPATTHIYHRPYPNEIVKPNYFYQEKPY